MEGKKQKKNCSDSIDSNKCRPAHDDEQLQLLLQVLQQQYSNTHHQQQRQQQHSVYMYKYTPGMSYVVNQYE